LGNAVAGQVVAVKKSTQEHQQILCGEKELKGSWVGDKILGSLNSVERGQKGKMGPEDLPPGKYQQFQKKKKQNHSST